MKKMIAIVALAITLTGCLLSQNEIEKARSVCYQQGGDISFDRTSNGYIVQVNCTIDGITYRVGESGRMYEGRIQ